jgi:hypothetical protein
MAVDVTAGKKCLVMGEDITEFSGFPMILDGLDGPGEDPRMPSQHRALSAFFQIDFSGHGWDILTA